MKLFFTTLYKGEITSDHVAIEVNTVKYNLLNTHVYEISLTTSLVRAMILAVTSASSMATLVNQSSVPGRKAVAPHF